ncbi:MAG: nucleotide exchange factor GrpE, partial [Oscillospiraceae bacterium]|nr:nucleotide exchange factor GrpE [Oscillospiraceae bacterium]
MPLEEMEETQAETQAGEETAEKAYKKKKDKKVDIKKTLESLLNTEKKLEEVQKELDSTKDSFQRTLAEYDNYRKRTAKEKTENFNLGKIQAVTNLLPVLDTLEFALNAPCQDESYKKGIEMVMTQAMNAFSNMGVEQIEAVGKEFDPNFHAAVMQEASEEFESGFVTKELQKGYKMGDKVIRPSTVAVAE